MERRLREGELLGVSATRALELGIDVGALDASIVVGYPGWLHTFFQQMGRAGRAGRDCLCELVGTDTVINQYVMKHPEFVFERPVERAVVDRDNPFVVSGHVCCATAELPVTQEGAERFGYASGLTLDVLEEKQKVRRIDDVWYHASPERPAPEVRLRGYGDESAVVMDADSELASAMERPEPLAERDVALVRSTASAAQRVLERAAKSDPNLANAKVTLKGIAYLPAAVVDFTSKKGDRELAAGLGGALDLECAARHQVAAAKQLFQRFA